MGTVAAGCAPLHRPAPSVCAPCERLGTLVRQAPARDPNIEIRGARLRMPLTLKRFYGPNPERLAWSEDGCLLPAAGELLVALKESDYEGLNPAEYHLPLLKKLTDTWSSKPGGLSDDAILSSDLDLLLTDAYLLYASHLLGGHTREDKASAQWRIIRRKADLVKQLADALERNSVRASLSAFVPTHTHYQHLRSALSHYRNMMKTGPDAWPVIADGPILKQGVSDTRVSALRRRLATEGYLENPGSSPFDRELEDAIRRFQTRHGIDPDGRVGPQTRAALNVSLPDRINQIKFSLDRLRWLPADLGPRHVIVNIPSFSLYTVTGGTSTLAHRVVVGKQGGNETPMMSDRISYLEFSPEWNVPSSIATQEMLPRIQADPSYLETNHLIVLPLSNSKASPIDPASIQWSDMTAEKFPYRLRQKAGPWNALGKVKFMFPNQYSVYIHGTAEKGLFDQRLRMFSHGCVRILEPFRLAQFVLNDPDWTAERLTHFMNQPSPVHVPVAQPVPVYLVYWTAWADPARAEKPGGPVHFREDVYGWDREWQGHFYESETFQENTRSRQ